MWFIQGIGWLPQSWVAPALPVDGIYIKSALSSSWPSEYYSVSTDLAGMNKRNSEK